MTLQEIKDFAIKHNACPQQLDKFKEFLDKGDKLSAWQTVLGNYDWLASCGFTMDIKEIEVFAKGIGKRWSDIGETLYYIRYKEGRLHGLTKNFINGILCSEIKYKNDLKHGLERWFHSNGQLRLVAKNKFGKKHGLFRIWDADGVLTQEINYKNGVFHGSVRTWSNGVLDYEAIFENGKGIEK